MTMKKERFHPSQTYAHLTVGDAVRVTRELQEFTQAELAERAGLSQPIISGIESGIESGRLVLGVERAKRLARALRVHPAVLLFPDWEAEERASA
jgi:transcriptional regulator with XRE-family HTH domain